MCPMSNPLSRNSFAEAAHLLEQFISNHENFQKLDAAAQLLVDSFRNQGKVISCGNGGSMCDAMHFAEELSGRFRADRPPLPALSISDASHISCVANDYGYSHVFSRFIEAIGQPGDVLLAISTSGNSENVIRAVHAARAKNIKIIALTGKDGGQLAELADIEIRAPFSDFADRAQEIHIKAIHYLIEKIEKMLF